MNSKADYELFVLALGLGEVGKLILTDGETVRSVQPRLKNAGKRLNIEVQVWVVGPAIYFRRVGSDQDGHRARQRLNGPPHRSVPREVLMEAQGAATAPATYEP